MSKQLEFRIVVVTGIPDDEEKLRSKLEQACRRACAEVEAVWMNRKIEGDHSYLWNEDKQVWVRESA